jgi:hypothetical protein
MTAQHVQSSPSRPAQSIVARQGRPWNSVAAHASTEPSTSRQPYHSTPASLELGLQRGGRARNRQPPNRGTTRQKGGAACLWCPGALPSRPVFEYYASIGAMQVCYTCRITRRLQNKFEVTQGEQDIRVTNLAPGLRTHKLASPLR